VVKQFYQFIRFFLKEKYFIKNFFLSDERVIPLNYSLFYLVIQNHKSKKHPSKTSYFFIVIVDYQVDRLDLERSNVYS
jgi:hypothetical protein